MPYSFALMFIACDFIFLTVLRISRNVTAKYISAFLFLSHSNTVFVYLIKICFYDYGVKRHHQWNMSKKILSKGPKKDISHQ